MVFSLSSAIFPLIILTCAPRTATSQKSRGALPRHHEPAQQWWESLTSAMPSARRGYENQVFYDTAARGRPQGEPTREKATYVHT